MPGTSKTKWAQLRVGLLAVVALAILFYLIFLMSATIGFFKPKSVAYTYMPDSAAIARNADVRLNGILIGQVSEVQLSGSNDPSRVIRLTLNIDNQYFSQIPVDSKAGLASQNLLGAKFVNIKKGMSSQVLKPGGEIQTYVTPEIEDLYLQTSTTLGALQVTIDKVNGIVSTVEQGKGTIGELLVNDDLYKKALAILDAVNQIAKDGEEVVSALKRDDNSVGKLLHDRNELYGQIHDGLDKINATIDKVNNGPGTISQFLNKPDVYDDTRKVLMQVQDLLAGLEAGQGTAGKLLKSDELHDQLKTTLTQVNTLLDKMNNGQGTIAELLNNPNLYQSIDGTTRELQGLLKDFRANPKKFLHIKLGLF